MTNPPNVGYRRTSEEAQVLLGNVPGVIILFEEIKNKQPKYLDQLKIFRGEMTREEFNLKWSPYYHPELCRPDLVESE